MQEFKKEFNDLLKKKTENLYLTINENVKTLEVQIENMFESEEIRPTIQKVKTLELLVEKLNLQFEAVRDKNKELDKIIKDIQEIANSPFNNLLGGDQNNIDEAAFNEIKDSVADLKKNLNKLKQDMFKGFRDHDTALQTKADEDVVKDLDEALHQGVDQVMTSSVK